jgi:serine/threonine-protein kinase RsbW
MQKSLEDVDKLVMSIKAEVCMALDRHALLRCEIAVSEVLTNIIAHAGSNARDACIDLFVTEDLDAVVIEIFDPAGTDRFDPRDHAVDLHAVDPLAESGRGLGLIHKCVDAIEYGAVDGRNRLALTFFKGGENRSSPKKQIAMHSGENS